MKNYYSLLFVLLSATILFTGGILATTANSKSTTENPTRKSSTRNEVESNANDDSEMQSRVTAKRIEVTNTVSSDEARGIDGTTVADDTAVADVKIESLDRQSIYERAIKSPTGMLPTDESLELFQNRVLDNPGDYASWMVIGRLYLRRAEEQDDFHDLINAENAFDNSLAINPKHIGSLTFKAIAQNQQHKFKAAFETAKQALELKPGNFTALAEMGDAQLQLGNLEAAQQLYQELHEVAETPGSFARLARLAELQGDLETAEEQLNEAIKKAHQFSQEPKDIAWYHWRLAELAWNQNQLTKCQMELKQTLDASPDDTAALISQAKLFSAQGQTTKAVLLIQGLVDRDPAPPTLAFLGDLYSVEGDSEKAGKYWQLAGEAMAEEAKFAGEAHLRERALFLLDHDQEIEAALKMTLADFNNRSDLYAHDAAAWAYFKNGQLENATAEIEKALASGCQDPLLQFHAMQIFAANQKIDAAKSAAAKLKASNPKFQPRLAAQANAVMESL